MMAPIGNNCLTDRLLLRRLLLTRESTSPQCPRSEMRPDPPSGPLARSGTAALPPGRVVSASRRANVRRPWPPALRSSTSIARLLRGASAPVIGQALNAAGVTDRSMPGEQVLMRIYDLFGENRPSHGGHQAGRPLRVRLGARARCRRRASRRPRRWPRWCSPSPGRSSRSTAPRGAGSCWPPPRPTTSSSRWPTRSGFDDVVATRYATGRRRHATTARSTASSCGGRASCGPSPRWAVEQRRRPGRELGLLATASTTCPMLGGGRPPGRREPRPAPGRAWRCSAAGRSLHLDVPAGRAQAAGGRHRAAAGAARARAARADPVRPVRHLRRRAHPEDGPGHRRRQPPQLLRPDGDGRGRWPSAGRPVRFLGKKEVFDAPVVGQVAKAMGGIRVERGTGSDEPLAEAAAALMAGEVVALMPRGHDPARQGVLRPDAQGPLGRGAARRDDRRAGDPGRPVGHREGVAALRAAAQPPRPRPPADDHASRSARP